MRFQRIETELAEMKNVLKRRGSSDGHFGPLLRF
jgi:hypothetical protein